MKRQITVLFLAGLFLFGTVNSAVSAPPPPGPKAAVQYEMPMIVNVLRASDVMMKKDFGAGPIGSWGARYDGLEKGYGDGLSLIIRWNGTYEIYQSGFWSGKIIKIGMWEEILLYGGE